MAENTALAFREFTQSHGIVHQFTCPYTPEQNGIAERKHRHLIKTTRALLHHSSLPPHHWFDAVATATYLINRLPSRTTHNKSPYYLLYHRHPDYSMLRTFGCRCYPFHPPTHKNKLSPTSPPCIFMGYSAAHKGYTCFNPLTSTYIISRHVKFEETAFPGVSPPLDPINHSLTLTSFPWLPPPSPTSTTTTNRTLGPPLQPPTTGLPNSAPRTSPNPPLQLHPSPSLPLQPSPSSQLQPQPITTPSSNISPQPTPPRLHPMKTRSQSGITKPRQMLNLLTSTVPTSDNLTYKHASKHLYWQRAMNS